MSASQLPTDRRTKTNDQGGAPRQGEAALVLDRYRLSRRLGAGAFGTVWLARDERLDREVAVKIVPRERIVGGRFEREARAAARLTHPAIVTLYEAAVDDDGAYLVSELVRGQTLDDLLEAGRLSDRDIVAIGMALCDALAHAHSEGVVHRDVKPSNVLVPDRPTTPEQLAKLTDFGVARVVGGDSLTRTGDVVGTAAYMAPEQAEGREAGAPADLYALALVLYESLTGINPLRAGTATQRARRLGAHLPPLRRQRRDLPRELGQGIDLALRPRPRERGTLQELRSALSASLDRVLDRPGVVASPWPRLTDPMADADLGAVQPQPAFASDRDADSVEDPQGHGAYPWPARGAAGLAAAVTTAWLTAHVLAPSPIAPAGAALIAGALVLTVPRAGWLALTGALTVAAILQHRPGGALAILFAALVPVALLPVAGTAWPLVAAAPGLGAIGLAGAWPALAARAGGVWRRAALGAAGWVWLALAGALTGADLYVKRLPGTPAPGLWTASLQQAVHDVIGPLVSSGVLAPALVWAAGAVVVPWLVSGRSLALDVIRVVVWAALVVSSTTTIVHGVHGVGTPSTAVLGGVASALIALSPTLIGVWRNSRNGQSSRTRRLPPKKRARMASGRQSR
jgi:hypothetical protein